MKKGLISPWVELSSLALPPQGSAGPKKCVVTNIPPKKFTNNKSWTDYRIEWIIDYRISSNGATGVTKNVSQPWDIVSLSSKQINVILNVFAEH